MGCFLACFGSSKTRRKKLKKHPIAGPVQALVNNGTSLCSKDAHEPEDLSSNPERKVVFEGKTEVSSGRVDNEIASKLSYSGSKSEEQLVPSARRLDFSYPPNHRYENCLDDDHEVEDLNYRDSCRDEEDDDDLKEECQNVNERSSMAIGSNWIDNVQPVLNPEEELPQIKSAEAEETPPLMNLEKENRKMDQIPPRKYDGMEVDASLSTWLGSSEITAEKSNSVRIWEEERPILGALTLEELQKVSASSTPRKSPNRSPDEIPIIGTVGTYWNLKDPLMESGSPSSFKGIPNTTSKYREDKRVNWHSTPFETRLERALNRGAA